MADREFKQDEAQAGASSKAGVHASEGVARIVAESADPACVAVEDMKGDRLTSQGFCRITRMRRDKVDADDLLFSRLSGMIDTSPRFLQRAGNVGE